MGARVGGAVVAVLVCGCGPSRPPAPPAQVATEDACVLHGVVTFTTRPSVFAAPSGERELGVVMGRIGVDLVGLEGKDRVRVKLRSAVVGPALHLDGFVSKHDVPVHAARAIAAVPGHVTIKAGTRLSLVSPPQRGSLHVSVSGGLCATPLSQSVETTTSCAGALAIGEGVMPRWSPRASRSAITYHDPHAPISLLGSPDGPVVMTLAAKDGPFTFELLETRGSARHVRYEEPEVLIDGWITAPPLVNEDHDRWGCGSLLDAYDPCAVVPASNDAECPDLRDKPIAVVAAGVPVRAAPDGETIGSADRGLRVHVLERRGGWASISPVVVESAIAPPRTKPGGFWVPADQLADGSSTIRRSTSSSDAHTVDPHGHD